MDIVGHTMGADSRNSTAMRVRPVTVGSVAHSQSPFGTPRSVSARPANSIERPPPTHDRFDVSDSPPTHDRPEIPEPPPMPGPDVRRGSPALHRAAVRAQQRSRGWLITLATVVAFIAVAACVTGTWLTLAGDGEQQAHATTPTTDVSASPSGHGPQVRDDAAPLSTDALFDAASIPAGYRVLTSQELHDCADAATDGLSKILAEVDCSQVVRATVVSPDDEYVTTLGVVNVAEAGEAEKIREHIDSGDGGAFTALRSDGPGEHLGLDPTVLGYNTYGHYVLYAVIGDVHGGGISRDDEAVTGIVTDLVDTYLPDVLAENG